MFPAPSIASWSGKLVVTLPVFTTVATFGDKAATAESLNAYSGTVSIGFCGLALSYKTTAPLRKPGAVGKNLIFTEQLAFDIPAVHVFPAATVKSRFCAPNVKAFTAPSVVDPMVKGSVTVIPLDVPSCAWPNPTAAVATVTTRLSLVSAI